jgi:hypothetical protein
MPAVVEELFHGRTEVAGAKPSAEIPYIVRGAADEAEVKSAVFGATPAWYAGMPRRAVEIAERIAGDSWRVEVRYEPPEPVDQEEPEPVIAFDSSGGTQHVTQSVQTRGSYGPAAADLGGAIGFDGENVAGVDVTVPVWNWSETHYLLDSQVNMAAYYSLTGRVNSDAFRGHSPGEVLFLGATGQKRGTSKWEVTFKFAAQPNRSDIFVGGIGPVTKRGWDYMWVQYGEDIDPAAMVLVKKPVAVYVEQVYLDGAFAQLGI